MHSFTQTISLLLLVLFTACGNKEDEGGNPVLPQLSASAVSQLEGDAASSLVFTVKLSAPSTKVVTVDFSTNDKSAVVGEDYLAQSGSLQFADPNLSTFPE